MKLFTYNKTFNEFQFEKEMDFEKEVINNSKLFFGQKTVYIDAKRKIETKNLGGSIPDGILFDLTDKNNPEFYLVEVELAKHDFFNHIFPQITKFFGFYKNSKSLNELIEKIFTIINNDVDLKDEFKAHIGDKEIYKYVKDTIEKSQNILLVLDGEKKELPEIMDTYSDTWGKMVKVIFVKKFGLKKEVIYTMHPEFENIEFEELEGDSNKPDGISEYTEEYHLDGVTDEIRKIYKDTKHILLKSYPKLIFNPQKYYISIRTERNIAFIKIRRKKIVIVVLNSESSTRKQIKYHKIKKLTPIVQKFWNGPSCAIIIESEKHHNEVIKLLKNLILKSK
jgi:hypothetical protein